LQAGEHEPGQRFESGVAGQGQAVLGFEVADVYCAFEQENALTLLPNQYLPVGPPPQLFAPRAFVRSTLKDGLKLEQRGFDDPNDPGAKLHINPFKLGFIGSTDTHNGTPGNVDELDALIDRGVLGFKAFMCPSGIDEFPACDTITLREGMARIARRGSILLVHAEDPVVLGQHVNAFGGTSAGDFVRSRPPDAELAAIAHAIEMAAQTSCRLHVVHVSTLAGMQMIRAAQGRGVDVSGETCPHYLLYVEDDLQRLGGVGKCFPPFRTAADRDGLWRLLATGVLPIVVSDHSPSTLELKEGDDFFKIWGGLSGCQSTRRLLLARSLDARRLAAATATNVARRFALAGKGEIAPGYDADLWLVDLTHTDVLRREELLYKNRFSAHEGQPVRGRTVRTIRRGETVFADGKVVVESGGRFMRPAAERS